MIILTFVVGFLRIYILLLSQPSSSFILSIHLLASSILLVFLQTLVPEPTLALPGGQPARLGRGGGPLASRPGVSLVEAGSAYGNQGLLGPRLAPGPAAAYVCSCRGALGLKAGGLPGQTDGLPLGNRVRVGQKPESQLQ